MQNEMISVGDVLLATGTDAQIAVIDGNRSYTYRDLRAAAARIAGAVTSKGVPRGSRIGLLGTNSFCWIAGYLAALKLGTVVPLSDLGSPQELAELADSVGVRVLLMDRRAERRFGSAFEGRVVLIDACEAMDVDPCWPAEARPSASDAALMFTSGTTSRPRAVRLTHDNILANTRSIVSYLGLEQQDRMLVVLPFHYCYGASLLHTHLAVGGSVALCNTFTFPETAVDMLERHQCTGLAGVPSSFQLLLRTSSFGARVLPSLRRIQQAGGRLPPEQIRVLASAQPGADLYVMYGQTEATARLSYLPPSLLESKLGSIGRGIPGVELKVIDESGNEVLPGAVGEIMARGANISPGYVDDPEATEKKFPSGALRTGDLATVDSEGFIFIVGRAGDFIKSWGYRISCQQIEEAATEHPDVLEAAAVGMPDPDAGESVVLVVISRPGTIADPTILTQFLRRRLAKHMIPKSIHVMEALPLTSSGKVSKAEIRRIIQRSPSHQLSL